MKKSLLLALVVVAVVGCSQNEEIENAGQNAKIEFGTVVKAGTKAVLTTNTNFSEFTVCAYKSTGDMGDAVTLTPFIDNMSLSKANNWATETPFYWPLTGKVQFFATSPKRDLDATSGYPSFSYTIKDVALQEDLVAASQINKAKGSGKIVLPFQHLLTQVNFSIKGEKPDFKYTVSGLKIAGTKGMATFKFDGTDKVGSWGSFMDLSEPVVYSYTGSPVAVAPTKETPDAISNFETAGNALFMLMPQTLTGVTLEITYTAAPSGFPTEYTYNATKTINLTGTWEMGKNIRYTLLLTDDASPIEFGEPTIGGWVDAAGTVE